MITFFQKEKNLSLENYLDESCVLFFTAKERNESLSLLVDLLHTQGKVSDKSLFFSAILEREKVVSTGIGLGVAIPHAKLSCYKEFFLAVGVQRGEEGIEWNALDGAPVRLIFMIGGPENRQADYLKILSSLTALIKDPVRRKKMMMAQTPKEVVKILFS